MDWKTPLGVTRIVRKEKDPTWYPPKSVRAKHLQDGDVLPESIPPGPDNPLGEYALRLGIPGGAYLIHGTNKPVGVGMQITHGCIRLYPEDIEFLFGEVTVGMRVRIVNQRIKTGWLNGALYLEHRVAARLVQDSKRVCGRRDRHSGPHLEKPDFPGARGHTRRQAQREHRLPDTGSSGPVFRPAGLTGAPHLSVEIRSTVTS